MFDDQPVRLMHYDARWRQEFQQTRSSILFSCDGWVTSVEHVGSTAIPGLIARPTIDVVAAVESADAISSAQLRIEGLNYRTEESGPWARDATVLVKSRRSTGRHSDPSHLVILTVRDSPLWRRVITLRDWLRGHPETAVRFEEAKVAHWRSGEGDLGSYQTAKAIFFAHLEDQINAALDG